MNISHLLSLTAFGLLATACKNNSPKDNSKDESRFFESPPTEVPALAENVLSNEPTDFLRSQAASMINWQPWTEKAIENAELSQRLLLLVVGSATDQKTIRVCKLLENEFSNSINKNYVPVLADIELNPDLALSCYALSLENNTSIAYPFFLWLSHERHPVAWTAITESEEDDILERYRSAHKLTDVISEKSQRYVVENSRYDNNRRLQTLKNALQLSAEAPPSPFTERDFHASAQTLIDLYDRIDKTFDNAGGIPPNHLITTLARLSEQPSISQRIKTGAKRASTDSLELLIRSAIRDPLDGLFFIRRDNVSFNTPVFTKHLTTQAEALSALASVPPSPITALAESQMLATLQKTPFRSHSLVQERATENNPYLWNLKTIEEILTPEETTIAELAFSLQPLGNISAADDPSRLFLRQNSLGLHLDGSSLAKAAKKPLAESERLLSSALTKLNEQRNKSFSTEDCLTTESLSTLSEQARLLTALTRLQSKRPTPDTLSFAETLVENLFTNYSSPDGDLLRCPTEPSRRPITATASDYALFIEALLEYHRLTWEPALLEKAMMMTTLLLDNFVDESNGLAESKPEEQLLSFPLYNHQMIFGPSSWATTHGILKRLASIGFEHPKLEPSLSTMTPLLQAGLKRTPLIHTDYLLSGYINLHGYALLVDENTKKQLANGLAQAEFDSVFTVTESDATANLGKLNGNQAILYKQGEPILTFKSTGNLLQNLRSHLSKN